jgi:hypothetical protein
VNLQELGGILVKQDVVTIGQVIFERKAIRGIHEPGGNKGDANQSNYSSEIMNSPPQC